MSERHSPSISYGEYEAMMDRAKAYRAFWDAVCADSSDVSYCDRESGVVDAQGVEIVDALLVAGWKAPDA